MKNSINIFWFRRDLRLNDNSGLFHALISGIPVLPVFIFDRNILEKLNIDDARVTFIYKQVQKLKQEIEKAGSSLLVLNDTPEKVFKILAKEYKINAVFTNKDYEPYSIDRDSKINSFLESKGIGFYTFKDHVIFEEKEILKDNGKPYTVFTPYTKKWKLAFGDEEIQEFSSEKYLKNLVKIAPFNNIKLTEIGFRENNIHFPEPNLTEELISNYALKRDIPAINGTTKLGLHLRFGTVSIRRVTQLASNLSEVFLNELIWRNFFIDILWHFPHVVTKSFKPKYELIQWRNNENDFDRWC